MTEIVTHYGVHWAHGGIAFLEQDQPRGGANALGMREKSPFRVQPLKRTMRCNHRIPLAAPNPDETQLQFFLELVEKDELVRAMLPIPKLDQGVYFLASEEQERLELPLVFLSKMSSPITSVVMPIWMMTLQQIMDQLQVTNVQPLVLIGITAEHTRTISQAAKAAAVSPRTLVMVGATDVVAPPTVRKIKTSITDWPNTELALLPWDVFGAWACRKAMRNEAPFNRSI